MLLLILFPCSSARSTLFPLGLGDIAGDPSRLILAEQLGCRSAPRLILEIDVSELLAVVVAHDKAGVVEFLDRPRRREAALDRKSVV